MKKFYSILSIILLSACCILAYTKHTMPTYGIFDIHTFTDYETFIKDIPIHLDGTTPAIITEKKDDYMNQLVSSTSETYIFVITAGNTYEQKAGCFIQNGVVQKVIAGTKITVDDNVELIRSGGINASSENLFVSGTINIMQPGEQYLVFCERSEYDDMISPSQYRIITGKFSCLNINTDDTAPIQNFSEEDDNQFATYSSCKGHEFLCSSKESLDMLLDIKHTIINTYLK